MEVRRLGWREHFNEKIESIQNFFILAGAQVAVDFRRWAQAQSRTDMCDRQGKEQRR